MHPGAHKDSQRLISHPFHGDVHERGRQGAQFVSGDPAGDQDLVAWAGIRHAGTSAGVRSPVPDPQPEEIRDGLADRCSLFRPGDLIEAVKHDESPLQIERPVNECPAHVCGDGFALAVPGDVAGPRRHGAEPCGFGQEVQ